MSLASRKPRNTTKVCGSIKLSSSPRIRGSFFDPRNATSRGTTRPRTATVATDNRPDWIASGKRSFTRSRLSYTTSTVCFSITVLLSVLAAAGPSRNAPSSSKALTIATAFTLTSIVQNSLIRFSKAASLAGQLFGLLSSHCKVRFTGILDSSFPKEQSIPNKKNQHNAIQGGCTCRDHSFVCELSVHSFKSPSFNVVNCSLELAVCRLECTSFSQSARRDRRLLRPGSWTA